MTPTAASVPSTAVPFPIRYFDCLLVVAGAAFALLLGAPVLGSVVGAGAWLLQRLLAAWFDRAAASTSDRRTAAGIAFAGAVGRPLLLAITILAVGLLGTKHDGLIAAVLVAVAFTVYLALTMILRPQRKSSP